MIKLPDLTRKELAVYLRANKDLLIAQKKMIFKTADACSAYAAPVLDTPVDANKANEPIDIAGLNKLKVKVVINTTNLLDSHMDVHLPGLWNKSLSENKMLMHLQEHKLAFDSIIADGNNVEGYTRKMLWKELNAPYNGQTEALIFESVIKQEGRKPRNPFMFEQYAEGNVKNHSVGMQYVQLIMCIDDKDAGAEYEAWQKYYPEIVNPERADEKGYFWAVKEAKVREGSAVPLGSNWITGTLDNNMKTEPGNHSVAEPGKTIQAIDYKYLMSNFKL